MENYEKLYKEALERARKLATDLPNGRNDRLYYVWDLESIFPELKESEDEKIKKAIVKIISDIDGGFSFEKYGIIKKEALAWLEKQGEQNTNTHLPSFDGAQGTPIIKQEEQKPYDKVEPKFKVGDIISYGISKVKIINVDKNKYNVTNSEIENDAHVCNLVVYFKDQEKWKLVESKSEENKKHPQPKQEWGEENEANMDYSSEIIGFLKNYIKAYGCTAMNSWVNWLKNIKDRVHPKQELSEEDEKKINGLVKGLEDRMGFGWASQPFTREEYIELLKSLKDRIQPQLHWKPSEKQIEAIKFCCANFEEYDALQSLYNDIKNL